MRCLPPFSPRLGPRHVYTAPGVRPRVPWHIGIWPATGASVGGQEGAAGIVWLIWKGRLFLAATNIGYTPIREFVMPAMPFAEF